MARELDGAKAGFTAVVALVSFANLTLVGCLGTEEAQFQRAHASLEIGMTLGEALQGGLGDYLQASGSKNLAGASRSGSPLDNGQCKRHVLDVLYAGTYIVRVYCDSNIPSARQLMPERRLDSARAVRHAIDLEYRKWTANLQFRVESPPRSLFGSYDHFRFSTDGGGRIDAVSPIQPAVQ